MSPSLPRLVTLEEHYLSSSFVESSEFDELYGFHLKRFGNLPGELQNIGNGRIEAMSKHSIAVQVLSHAPGLRTLQECQAANDKLHAATLANPDHFAGFAVLPVDYPEVCSDELIRCVKELGFKGALIDHQTSQGTHFTGPQYYKMWRTFEQLDVPCYLHPVWPTESQIQAFYADANVPAAARKSISDSSWGWHSDTASHVLQLFASGTFDRFPKLKLILGHFGEMIPFMLERIELFSHRYGGFVRTFKEVYADNIWITTSGVWSLDPLATVLRNTSIDHILFSIDYPFAKLEQGLKWWEELAESGMVNDEDLGKIAHKNAERLLKL